MSRHHAWPSGRACGPVRRKPAPRTKWPERQSNFLNNFILRSSRNLATIGSSRSLSILGVGSTRPAVLGLRNRHAGFPLTRVVFGALSTDPSPALPSWVMSALDRLPQIYATVWPIRKAVHTGRAGQQGLRGGGLRAGGLCVGHRPSSLPRTGALRQIIGTTTGAERPGGMG